MDNVRFLILLIVINKDVNPGTMDNALSAQKDGICLMETFVKRLTIFVILGQMMGNASNVIKDMLY